MDADVGKRLTQAQRKPRGKISFCICSNAALAQSARAPLLCIKNVPPPPKTTHDFLHHPRVFPQPPLGSQHVLTRLFLRGISLHAFTGLTALLCAFLCSPEPLGPGMLSPWQGWAGTRSIVIFPSVLYSSVRVPGLLGQPPWLSCCPLCSSWLKTIAATGFG